jgi:hypothetical protein
MYKINKNLTHTRFVSKKRLKKKKVGEKRKKNQFVFICFFLSKRFIKQKSRYF